MLLFAAAARVVLPGEHGGARRLCLGPGAHPGAEPRPEEAHCGVWGEDGQEL